MLNRRSEKQPGKRPSDRGCFENSIELTLTSGIQLTETGNVSLQVIGKIFHAVQVVFDIRRRIERLDYRLIKHRRTAHPFFPLESAFSAQR